MEKVIHANSTRKQLAAIYEVHLNVIRGWLADIGITHSKQLTPKEILALVESAYLPAGVTVLIKKPNLLVQEQKSLFERVV